MNKCEKCNSERIENCGAFCEYDSEKNKAITIYTYTCLDCGHSWNKR